MDPTPRQALETVLLEALALVGRPDGRFLWSGWDGPDDARAEVQAAIAALRAGAGPDDAGAVLFLPTGPLQELALDSGWSAEQQRLADRWDAAAAAARAEAAPVAAFLAGLPAALSGVPDEAALAAVVAAAGPEVAAGRSTSGLRLRAPVDARAVALAWGVERPLGVSGDVHQVIWQLVGRGADLDDPHRPRCAAEPVVLGDVVVRASLAGRPVAPLPVLACGASPAYDLLVAPAGVAAIELALRP